VAADAHNSSNSCEVCDPDQSASAYSADVGANCGSDATECSGQDTCNASAACRPNHFTDRTVCGGGYCEGGACTVPVFDCIGFDPPVIDLDAVTIISASGSPPTPMGGTVPDGRYTPVRVDFWGDQPGTIDIYSFEFDGIFVQAAEQPNPAWVPAWSFAGLFTPMGNTLEFDFQQCEGANVDIVPQDYSVTASGLLTFETYSNGTRVMISYLRE